MIFIATILTRRHKKLLKECKVPVVILGQLLEGYPCIFQDDYKAAGRITEAAGSDGK